VRGTKKLQTRELASYQKEVSTKAKGSGAGRRNPGRRSEASENYLLALRILEEDGVAPHMSELAEYLRRMPAGEGLGTTLASVSGMVHRMAKESLVNITKSKQIILTDPGKLLATDVVRRHRLSELLLVTLLDVPLERAEIEAHRLEHGISPELLERIEAKLGFPDTCPYGRPIYRADETTLRTETKGVLPLNMATGSRDYIVVRIPDEVHSLLKFLVQNKILPGQKIRVNEVAPYRGVVDLERDEAKISVGIDVAARIRVKPA
jgi:DtxR family Mn-dependent transcriptional regulator